MLCANIQKSIGFTTYSDNKERRQHIIIIDEFSVVFSSSCDLISPFRVFNLCNRRERGESLVFMTSMNFFSPQTFIHNQKELQTEIIIINLKFIRKYQKKLSMEFGNRNEKELQVAYYLYALFEWWCRWRCHPNIH